MKCPRCGKFLGEPSGMCCNAGKDSGYQYYCENCRIWLVETFDGRILIDEFLTLVVQPTKEKGGQQNNE